MGAAPDEGPVDGRFALLHKLGEGTFGEVWKARDRDGHAVAVKLLRRDFASSPEVMERFRREIVALARLAHPAIVRLHTRGHCARRGQPYFVMDWVPGVSLRALLDRERRLAPARARRLFDQLLDALATAHGAGILHRDLKPENLLVEAPGTDAERIRVLDFGLAKHQLGGAQTVAELTEQAPLGTPHYMSPEQWLGEGVGLPTDVYAVGCLFMEALSGRPPFDAPTFQAVLLQHLQSPPPRLDAPDRWPAAPREWVEAVDACLSKFAADRPDALALRRALAAPALGPEQPLTGPARADVVAPTLVPRSQRETQTPDYAAPTLRAKFDLLDGQRVFVFAGTRLRFGRARENDLVLRAFPRPDEDASQTSARTSRISARHGSLRVTTDGVVVADDGSTHGTSLDGRRLERAQPVAVGPSFVVDVAGVVELHGRVRSGSISLARERHSYVLIVDAATIGSGPDDALRLPADDGVVPGHAWLQAREGRFFLTAAREDAPVLVAGAPIAPGVPAALRNGAEVQLGATRLRFSSASDEDMKP